MTTIEILGFTSAFLTTFSFLPQVIQVFKTRDTASLSLAMYSIFTVGVAGWLVYGIFKQDSAVIVANMVTLLLSACILSMKLYNDFATKRSKKLHEGDHLEECVN
ncbi:SemiSWEET family sugar transporter [Agaribacter flavus]|uniref:SemiSWEET family sugar transporter n=1 Tax=Agaribacter flavus TaxID=1902781 RepID=A0ABV7FSH5_9ALTE